MSTKQNYTHIQVTAGIGVPVNPHGDTYPNWDEEYGEDDIYTAVAQKRWSDWQAAHAGIQWHCLNHDGTAVADNTYDAGDFGDEVFEWYCTYHENGIKVPKWRPVANGNEYGLADRLKEDGRQVRLVRYLKQRAEVQGETVPESIEQAAERQKCEKCGGRTALCSGMWYYDPDDEPYLNGVREKAKINSGEDWIHGFKCDDCGHLQKLWYE